MLRDVTIQNYRCFKDFTIDGLSQINLIVGSNQIGKTSFLEAIYLLANKPGKRDSLLDILEQRGEFYSVEQPSEFSHERLRSFYLLNHLFYGHEQEDNEIQIIANKEKSLCVRINNRVLLLEPKVKTNSVQGGTRELKTPISKDERLPVMLRKLHPYIFISTNRMSFNMMAKIWENIQLTAKEDKVVEALQIIEPKVQRIGFPSSKGQKMIRVKLQGENRPLPLNSMGDGMNRLLGLALGAVAAENGVLLVDEIDTGLHYEVQADMWELIIKTAQELNIQVFATTHSWDCICALQEVLPDLEDDSVVKLFRLSKKYGKLRAVEYDAEDIDIAVQQSIEVR